MSSFYVPYTPGGSCLIHLKAKTEQGAWDKLLHEASHMPYKTKENFIKRGYEVVFFKDAKETP
jgi:hypothetical protein